MKSSNTIDANSAHKQKNIDQNKIEEFRTGFLGSVLPVTPKISTDELRKEIKKEYTNVAIDPQKGYHFHTGRLYIGDIILSKALPKAALDDISLWTG